ncbi:VOC family protein [Marinilactibacillus kalidii]|uniref:SMU1112c/YaeR family gloxylase I-like metalloprotein n=1 Tax=Marinilactibacillus kalidii TaxID=2820274 RepID=UPI001ABDD56B|nr:VOC family protein [Marinilactibacillus kalidii]
MLERIHHTAIIASNYEESKKFYTETLELPIVNELYREERDSYKLDLAIGDAQIELFSFPDPPERPSTPEAQGLRHLCFEINDIDHVVKWLENKSVIVEPIRIDPVTGKRFTFFKDPDGLPLELYEK